MYYGIMNLYFYRSWGGTFSIKIVNNNFEIMNSSSPKSAKGMKENGYLDSPQKDITHKVVSFEDVLALLGAFKAYNLAVFIGCAIGENCRLGVNPRSITEILYV